MQLAELEVGGTTGGRGDDTGTNL